MKNKISLICLQFDFERKDWKIKLHKKMHIYFLKLTVASFQSLLVWMGYLSPLTMLRHNCLTKITLSATFITLKWNKWEN